MNLHRNAHVPGTKCVVRVTLRFFLRHSWSRVLSGKAYAKALSIHRQLINISELAESLGEDNCGTLLGFYVYSGEDCTSAFKGKGTVGPLKKVSRTLSQSASPRITRAMTTTRDIQLKPGPHSQQCRSNVRLCRKEGNFNAKLVRHCCWCGPGLRCGFNPDAAARPGTFSGPRKAVSSPITSQPPSSPELLPVGDVTAVCGAREADGQMPAALAQHLTASVTVTGLLLMFTHFTVSLGGAGRHVYSTGVCRERQTYTERRLLPV